MGTELSTQRTSKKVKYVGTQQFLNTATGEIEDFQVTSIEERDFNFSKVWMRNFVATLDLVGNQKTKLAFWIIDNVNKENQLIATLRSMSDATGMSLETVRKTMSILQGADFLRKSANGVYVVNPDIVFKGTRNARINILNTYKELGYEEPKVSDEQKISNLQHSIEVLQDQLNQLLSSRNVVDAEINGQMAFNEDGQIFETATIVDEKPKRTRTKK